MVEIGPDAVGLGAARREAIPADAVFLLTGYLPDVAPRGGGRARRPGDAAPRARPRDVRDERARGSTSPAAIVSGADSHKVFIENGRFHGAAIVKAILEKAAARA